MPLLVHVPKTLLNGTKDCQGSIRTEARSDTNTIEPSSLLLCHLTIYSAFFLEKSKNFESNLKMEEMLALQVWDAKEGWGGQKVASSSDSAPPFRVGRTTGLRGGWEGGS